MSTPTPPDYITLVSLLQQAIAQFVTANSISYRSLTVTVEFAIPGALQTATMTVRL